MKKMFFLMTIGLLCMIGKVFPVSPSDSLLTERNKLYYQFLDIRNNTTTFLMTNCMELNDVLEQIVVSDNHLLDTLAARDKRYASYRDNIKFKDTVLRQNADDLSAAKTSNLWLLVGIAAIGALFLVFFILFVLNRKADAKLTDPLLSEIDELKKKIASRCEELELKEAGLKDSIAAGERLQTEKKLIESYLRDKTTESATLQKDISDKKAFYESKIASQETELAAFRLRLDEKETALQHEMKERERILVDNERQVTDLRSEISNFNNTLKHLEGTITERDDLIEKLMEELHSVQKFSSETKIEQVQGILVSEDQYHKELGEMDVTMAKIEKLEDLRRRNLITDIEFDALRQKFLNEFK
jgi:hypothetical protein